MTASPFPPIDPEKSRSSTPVRVRFGETDLMGIVHHATYLLYFEVGRVEWLRRRGVTYAQWANEGVHLPVVEANATYQTPARFDDLLEVETTLTELRAVSLKFAYRILRGETQIAAGYTRLGCIDATYKLMRFPDSMRDILMSGEI